MRFEKMNKKTELIVGKTFLPIGIVLIILCIWLGIRHMEAVQNSFPITATITDIQVSLDAHQDVNRTVFIEYEVDGHRIHTNINWSSSGMQIGDNIEILVSYDDPYSFVAGGLIGWIATIAVGLFGIIFTLIGGALVTAYYKRIKRHKWLLENGNPVWANVQGTEVIHSVMSGGGLGGRHVASVNKTTVIKATYKNMQFISESVSNKQIQNLGSHLKVFIHPSNPDEYTFDLFNESNRQPLEPAGAV